MNNREAIEIINSWYGEDKESDEAIKKALEALEIVDSLPLGFTIQEVVARNIMAWETSKDKTQGMLPEVYETDCRFFIKLTGLDPTWNNLKKFYKDVM